MTDKPSLGELRNAAIAKRDAAVAEATAQFATDRAAEDRAFDLVHDLARDAYEAARKRPRPDYFLAKARHQEALAQADKELDAEIVEIYRLHGVIDDPRYPTT
jgi:hypothetical protein